MTITVILSNDSAPRTVDNEFSKYTAMVVAILTTLHDFECEEQIL